MNIKIGKGGSGKVNSTKGGSGKTNEKKYIDLLPPNFINKVTLSNAGQAPEVNGIYTRNSGGTTQFEKTDGAIIVWSSVGNLWANYSNGDPLYISYDLINWQVNEADGPPTGATENSLSFLFDPIFYKSEIQNERYKILVSGCTLPYVNGIYSQQLNLVNGGGLYVKDDDSDMSIFFEDEVWYIRDANQRNGYYDLFIKFDAVGANTLSRPDRLNWSICDGGEAYNNDERLSSITQYLALDLGGGRLDPVFLEQIRNYQIDNAVPNQNANNNLNPLSRQKIIGAAFNTKKAEIKNNTFSYIKYSDNTDVEGKKLNKFYGSIDKTQTAYGISPPKDSKYPLLTIKRNDALPIFEIGTYKYSTLNMFIRLQRPVSHKNPKNSNYIVREKRGIFCTSQFNSGNPFSIGYRSPYYNITGRPSYKKIFDNFSFVFSFGSAGYDTTLGRPISRNLMTDYKFNFGQMYMLTIISDNDYLRIYINGELQTVAIVPFNPLVNPTTNSGRTKNKYAARRDLMPLGPGFYKKNGAIYTPTSTQSGGGSFGLINYLIFGKSALAHGSTNTIGAKKRRRYLNNLDIGVINSYNTALSQSDISQIYNNFRYRYI